MPPNNAPQPQIPKTPSKPKNPRDVELDNKIAVLCSTWPLGLRPKEDHSPSKNKDDNHDRCLFLIKWCFHQEVLDDVVKTFERRAEALYRGWVNKPRADRGVVPQITKFVSKPISDKEVELLLTCLIEIMKEHRDKYQPPTTPRPRKLEDRFPGTDPIAFPLNPLVGTDSKRPRDESFADVVSTKKVRAMADKSRRMAPPPKEQHPVPPTASPLTTNTNPPPFLRHNSSLNALSANTSFASNTSSVFSKPSFEVPTMPNTQDTEFDEELPLQKTQENGPAFTTLQEDKYKSSDYGTSSSFERNILNTSFDGDIGLSKGFGSHVSEELSHDLRGIGIEEPLCSQKDEVFEPQEIDFLAKLEAVFPGIPTCLRSAPFFVIYEITRVFLHAGVPLQDLDAPITNNLKDYDVLWKFLKSLPMLEDRLFPEKCGAEVWKSAIDDKVRAGNSVVLAGNLLFGTDLEPVISLRLEPLKLDRSHRLGRRLGHDRFLEICMPSLTDKKVLKSLGKVGPRLGEIFYDWLVDSNHCLLGRDWQPFCVKPRERSKSKKDVAESTEAEASFRVYFFAVNGLGFRSNKDHGTRATEGRYPISISKLLNIVRPTEENTHQSYLKLFSRTTLALSRNNATIVVQQDQIRFQKEDIRTEKEVMNDGAARISLNLANKVRLHMGLSYLPSAFQARFGEAKGLWVVDGNNDFRDDWIEVFPSQQKWKRDSNPAGQGISDDPSHRTFEVLKYSGPLKSADLNTQFLPLLVAQAIDRKAMKRTLSKILKDGLSAEVIRLKEAFENPQVLRKWVRESKPSIVERLKFGALPFLAGLPNSLEERINVLLDAGFSPASMNFLYEQAKKIFETHCENLTKKLNITVGKSTYAFMIPDFWGVLEPDEVYIDVSRFEDDVTGDYGAYLNGVDLLVARSPAHFVSDIQKVKSVAKAELMGLKDVIVFSTKGKSSLASKLSGGDYDGDIAWICWDENIVDNFKSAKVPATVDLVKEGFLSKDAMKYRDLVKGSLNPTSIFLKKALEFNMQQSMLGKCTNFKEKVCYTQKSVDTKEARYLSQLLSDLVDAPKQGFIFDEEAFTKFKKFLGIVTVIPKYISGDLDGKLYHILDVLMLAANDTIKESMAQLWKGFKKPPTYDKDLVLLYKKAEEHSKANKEWETILGHLRKELTPLKDDWGKRFPVREKRRDMSPGEFGITLMEFYDRFRAIRPPDTSTPLAQALLMCSGIGNSEELSQWSLLKASAFFGIHVRKYGERSVGNAVWWIAGRQLCRLKSDALETGLAHTVAPYMFIILKPDNSMIGRLMSDGNTAMLEESGSVRNVEELEELYD